MLFGLLVFARLVVDRRVIVVLGGFQVRIARIHVVLLRRMLWQGKVLLINGFSLPLIKNKLNFWHVNGKYLGLVQFLQDIRQPGPTNLKNVFSDLLAGGKSRKVSVFEAESFHRLWPDRRRCLRTSPPYRRWKAPYRLPFCSGSLRLRLRFRSGTPGELEPGRANATDCAACFSVAMDRFSAVREQGDYNDDRNRYVNEVEQY